MSISSISECIQSFQQAGMLLVMDDEDRENEGDLFLPAQFATPEKIAFILRHTTGILCVSMPSEWAERLNLPLMVMDNTDPNQTAFTVSCDHISAGTGVSAQHRSITISALADPATQPNHLRRPGHIFPLIAKAGGVLQRRGHTEACVDFCKLAGLRPVGLLSELQNKDGTMMRFPDCVSFATKHSIPITTIEKLTQYRQQLGHQLPIIPRTTFTRTIELITECDIPIHFGSKDLGNWTLKVFLSHPDRTQHLALIKGDIGRTTPVLTRIHSECLTGDTLGSQRCDCGSQLHTSMSMIHQEGQGLLLYLTGHEGRGIGLINKIKAYHLQSSAGVDTYQANECLGFPPDSRNYETAQAILQELQITRIKLISNNPEKMVAFLAWIDSVVPLSR